MKKLRFQEQKSLRAISRRFRRMNEDNIQGRNSWCTESTSYISQKAWSLNFDTRDNDKISLLRVTKRDGNILNRRRDKEMHTHWAFHIQWHWTSSWNEIWSQTEELFMTSSKATTVNLTSIFKILSNLAKLIQKTVITHITSFNSSTFAKSTRRIARWSVRWTVRWTVRWIVSWTIIETIKFFTSSSENQSTDRQSSLITENLKHSNESSVESSDKSLDESLDEFSIKLSVESSVKSSVESSVKFSVKSSNDFAVESSDELLIESSDELSVEQSFKSSISSPCSFAPLTSVNQSDGQLFKSLRPFATLITVSQSMT